MKANARNSIRLSTTSAVELLFTINSLAETEALTVVVATAAVDVVPDVVVRVVVVSTVVPIKSIFL